MWRPGCSILGTLGLPYHVLDRTRFDRRLRHRQRRLTASALGRSTQFVQPLIWLRGCVTM
jgi:hypothetical protein